MTTLYETPQMRIEDAYADFVARYPAYSKTAALDALRSTEYSRLDEQHQVYLDYTGGSLYGESQVQEHAEILRAGVLGNPHSSNPTSVAMTDYVERTRRYLLTYFNTSPDDYVVVFTQNATAALKLIGESFPFSAASRLLLTFDNHNSVNGIREFARAAGAGASRRRRKRPPFLFPGEKVPNELHVLPYVLLAVG